MTLRSFFIDFNSYFASVEQQTRPELRGLPVGVVPVMAETTCCIAASYEAKAFGIRTGTQVAEARRRCPDIRIVQARPPVYIDYHHRLVKAVKTLLPVDRVLSIDEMVCTLDRRQQQRDEAERLARRVKQIIHAFVGQQMRSSIGIAPNGFLAKLASKLEKPDGLVVIERQNLPEQLYTVDISELYGVGPRMVERLNSLGIFTMKDLYAAGKATLKHAWNGIEGERMYDRLRGEQVYTPPTRKSSLGHSHVLAPDVRSPQAAWAIIQKLSQKAATRLRHEQLVCNRLLLQLDYFDKRSWRDKLKLDPTDDTLKLLRALRLLWQRRPREAPQLLRVGVVLAGLGEKRGHTLSLFAEEAHEREQLNTAMDAINKKFGRHSIYFGGAHTARDSAPMRIAFTHIPDPQLEDDN